MKIVIDVSAPLQLQLLCLQPLNTLKTFADTTRAAKSNQNSSTLYLLTV